MKLKADWLTYLHHLREREMGIIFKRCPENSFDNALELGAGDGFQSKLLVKYVKNLLATEYNEERLLEKSAKRITYKICDAEEIDRQCEANTFDLIFSSNLMEHIQKREVVFQKLYPLLKDDGVMIHVMPSCFLKLCWMGLFHFNLCVEFIEAITKPNGFKKIYQRFIKASRSVEKIKEEFELHTNNPKKAPRSFMQRYIWPLPHGEYSSHWQEFWQYRKMHWVRLIEAQGFEVKTILKMPVVSGYGFGFNSFRWILEKLGLTSSYAYVAFKKKKVSPYKKYWG